MVPQLVILAVLAAASILLFFPLNGREARRRESPVQPYVPFIPAFIVPYLILFPYVAFSMLVVLYFTPVATRLYVSLIFGGICAALIWAVMPVTVSERPEVEPKGIFTRTVAWVYRIDPRSNAFPSSHTYTAILCSYYLAYAFPLHSTLIWTSGATIVSSTLFVKQHHVVDLIAGMALAGASIFFSYYVLGALP